MGMSVSIKKNIEVVKTNNDISFHNFYDIDSLGCPCQKTRNDRR
jgi:hypothetical protein